MGSPDDHVVSGVDYMMVLYITGDGGNDVSMIQAADAGIGIVGKVRRLIL
jgi:P-type E1-E2 ATPase